MRVPDAERKLVTVATQHSPRRRLVSRSVNAGWCNLHLAALAMAEKFRALGITSLEKHFAELAQHALKKAGKRTG